MSNEEIKKETEVTATGKTIQKVDTANELTDLFKNEFATGLTRVYVNSLGKDLGFKEITVTQQKTLSRIMIGNEQRKDVIYDAQCGIINEACADEGFDIYNLTEFDRLKLLIVLYQANMFGNEVKFTCKECGTENAYHLNFDNVLTRLDEIGLEPKTFNYENKNFIFNFTIAYPNVRTVSTFHKSYCNRHRATSKRDVKTNDNMSNMEYIDLFISKVSIKSKKEGGMNKDVDFSNYRVEDLERILETFPQDVLYSDKGVLNFITTEYLQKINDSFDKHQCFRCGAVQEEEGANQSEGFL